MSWINNEDLSRENVMLFRVKSGQSLPQITTLKKIIEKYLAYKSINFMW